MMCARIAILYFQVSISDFRIVSATMVGVLSGSVLFFVFVFVSLEIMMRINSI